MSKDLRETIEHTPCGTLEVGWRGSVAAQNIKVRNADSNFISFCKKRGPYKNEELF